MGLLENLLDEPLPRIESVTLSLFHLPLKAPFETSFGSIDHREIVLCELKSAGLIAFGESAADADPLYSYETTYTNWEVLKRYLIPSLSQSGSIGDFLQQAKKIRGHPMAKSALENALWDLLAKSKNEPLFRLWGGTQNRIACGVSVGLQKDMEATFDVIRGYLSQGYRRIKIKIKPGKDLNLVEPIRTRFPELPLMVDANAAYTLEDMDLLQSLDKFNLMMIEQPLYFEDVFDHSVLQNQMKTPLCLDESLHSVQIARAAIQLKSCKIFNIKTGRVGGHAESIRIHDVAMAAGIPVWCGGMLESGIGRAHNIALAALPNFKFPGDTSASNRYWHHDVSDPEVIMDPDGYITLPEKPGIGYELDRAFLASLKPVVERVKV